MSRRQEGERSSRAQIRRWVAGHRAAQTLERELSRREGPQPERAAELALSMIEAARVAGVPCDPLRTREVARGRATWRRLRKYTEQQCRSLRETPFLRALAALRDAFRDCATPAAVIGGVAIIARGVARHTADIDA